MPGNIERFRCVYCKKRTPPKQRRSVTTLISKYIQATQKYEVAVGDTICNACRHKCDTKAKQTVQLVSSSPSTPDPSTSNDPTYIPATPRPRCNVTSPPSVTLHIKSTSKSHSRCFICKREGPKMIVVTSSTRISAYIDHNIIINAGTRCCPVHIENNKIMPDLVKSLPTAETALVNRRTILNLLNSLREICNHQNNRLDFDTVNDTDCNNLTGLQLKDFREVCQLLEGKIRNTPARTLSTTVGLFFLKLKSGMSNKLLSTVFGLTKSCVRRAITSVRLALMMDFVPKHLGLSHITREEVVAKHTTPLAQALFGGGPDESGDRAKLIVVLDGTYIYIQKSGNFQFQRRSFSMHKGRPLVKPMVVVTTTGYFLTIVGPFFADAKNSDAKILNHMLRTNVEDLRTYVKEEDVFVVDRGFRDSLLLLEDLGIKAEMPAFMVKGQTQMPTEDANSSRLVTKIRWVVESANARIKRWKYLDRVLPNSQVPFIGDFVRIACAVANRFSPPLATASDTSVAVRMLAMSSQANALKDMVEERHLERRSAKWTVVQDVELEDFPRLSEDQLREMICGVYQLKLAPSYIQEHVSGNCDIFVHTEEDNLIRVRMQSRHTSARTYLLWLQYTHTEVTAWYCKCRAGGRVVGVCAHIAAMLWYLAFARYRYLPEQIGVKNWGTSILDASSIPEPVDVSDSSSDED